MEGVLVISSEFENINKVRIFLKDVYDAFSLSMISFNKVFLGISEAVNNAILHGNKLNPEKKVVIRANMFGNELHVEVEDEGEGFCQSVLFDPTLPEYLKRENGRGIFIIQQLADEIIFKDGGRKLYIIFTISE